MNTYTPTAQGILEDIYSGDPNRLSSARGQIHTPGWLGSLSDKDSQNVQLALNQVDYNQRESTWLGSTMNLISGLGIGIDQANTFWPTNSNNAQVMNNSFGYSYSVGNETGGYLGVPGIAKKIVKPTSAPTLALASTSTSASTSTPKAGLLGSFF